jgi:dihydropteroate synthase
MGIVNVTPDSFSDGGDYSSADEAVKRAVEMVGQGATIIDIGGESTRPGAERVPVHEQLERIIPVIKAIRQSSIKDIIISVDSTRFEVAKAALEAGANWLNDISAGSDSRVKGSKKEPMLSLAAKSNCPIILMHRQGESATMQNKPHYDDVCVEVYAYLSKRAQAALDAGISKDNIIVDPGIGFGKLLSHNLQLLAGLDSLVSLGYKVLLGTSRKRFLGDITGVEIPQERVVATCATTSLGVNAGVNIFRVHDVRENKQAMDVAWHIKQAS